MMALVVVWTGGDCFNALLVCVALAVAVAVVVAAVVGVLVAVALVVEAVLVDVLRVLVLLFVAVCVAEVAVFVAVAVFVFVIDFVWEVCEPKRRHFTNISEGRCPIEPPAPTLTDEVVGVIVTVSDEVIFVLVLVDCGEFCSSASMVIDPSNHSLESHCGERRRAGLRISGRLSRLTCG